MSYVFLKSADRHEHRQNPVWYAVSKDRIEMLNVSDAYDQYGQQISSSDAGDYIEILTQEAAQVANEVWNDPFANEDDPNSFLEKFTIGDYISAYDYRLEFDEVITQCKENVDYEIHKTQFEGFTYWDGHNWKSIVVSSIDDNNTHEIEDDEEIIFRLNTALENGEFVKDGFGTKTYRYKDAEITYSQFSSAWEYAEITLNNEF